MKLRHYETIFLLHPDLSNEDRQEAIDKFSQIITNDEGQMVNIDQWPLRKLAYEVQHQRQGYYVVMNYGAPGSAIEELTRNFRLDERVMKFMTTKLHDEFDYEEAMKKFVKKEAEQASTSAEPSESEMEEKGE